MWGTGTPCPLKWSRGHLRATSLFYNHCIPHALERDLAVMEPPAVPTSATRRLAHIGKTWTSRKGMKILVFDSGNQKAVSEVTPRFLPAMCEEVDSVAPLKAKQTSQSQKVAISTSSIFYCPIVLLHLTGVTGIEPCSTEKPSQVTKLNQIEQPPVPPPPTHRHYKCQMLRAM